MAFALVKSNTGTIAAATSFTPAFGSATTAGNLIVVSWSGDNVSSGVGATGWTQSANMEQVGFNGGYLWWRISAGETSFSAVGFPSSTNASWVIQEFSAGGTITYDVSQGQVTSSGGNSYTTPNATPTTGSRLLVAAILGSSTLDVSGAYTSWLNSFTAIANIGTSAVAGDETCAGTAYRLVTGDGATTFSSGATFPNTCGGRVGLIISFAEGAAPAFGDLKGTLSGTGGSVTNPSNATGSVAVSVGDLIVGLMGQQTALTASACTDNLGNTYTAQNAGTDGGAATGRMFYSRVTNAGTLTTVSFTATASANDFACVAGVFLGPFVAPPIDANPANTTADLTSPYTCPATGTLAQAAELVIAWIAAGGTGTSAAYSATSPNLMAVQANSSTNIKAVLGYQVVAATTTVTPAFTAASGPTANVLGTASFMQAASTGPQFGGVVSSVTRKIIMVGY